MGRPRSQRVAIEKVFQKPVHVEFDQPRQSTEGGVVLLRAIDQRIGLTTALASALRDRRQPGKVRHDVLELLRQRIFAIACGYPDGNDARELAHDPAMKMVCGRSPVCDQPLGSQPTLSRFENSISPVDLLRMSYALAESVLRSQRRLRGKNRVRRIIVDIDGVDDPVHGEQQLSLFNRYYDNYCYIPLVASVQFDADPQQFVVAAMLRSGGATGDLGAVAMLQRLVPMLRENFPRTSIAIRMDARFSGPGLLDWCEAEDLVYYAGFQGNSALLEAAEPLLAQARRAGKLGPSGDLFGETNYQTRRSWDDPRRMVIRAQVVRLGDREIKENPRFVVTNDEATDPEGIYRIYTARGDVENRYKELKDGLSFDRASCSSADANQFRYLLTVAAFTLMQHLRQSVDHPDLVRAQVSTLRERLLKLAVRIYETARRLVLKAPAAFGWITPWRHAALACSRLRL
jgi:Transposase DDE domain group 1